MSTSKNIKPALRNLAAGDVLFREGEVGDIAVFNGSESFGRDGYSVEAFSWTLEKNGMIISSFILNII